ncbi:M56 family metallopeptidase [Marinilongibacter aquaticus]|uniref:M56 family metallopeptidase n=1 Tax=Marinilongibacter aquaticus TaxID=2975157 RepID=UPI0021BD24AE|nr:M56 family metallopeptidase [Marinilongibacter aquaticus]UBM60073.1 M56 family metallopeptidase [Marinilongibacter aquaticus]
MNWLSILLQVNLYLTLGVAFYFFFLRKETFHQQNRIYLLLFSIVAFLIPFVELGIVHDWFVTSKVSDVVAVIPLEEFTVSPLTEEPEWSWNILAINIYFIGFGFGLLKFSLNLFKLQQLFSIQHLEGQAFSVFGKVVVDKKLNGYEAIRQHEEVHSKEFHSIDVFWFELIAVICWFNPIVYFLRKEIKLIHEYIADDTVAAKMGSPYQYAQILVSSHFNTDTSLLVNNFFNQSILKSRIAKLSQTKSKPTAKSKYLIVVPLLVAMLVVANACRENIVPEASNPDPLSLKEDNKTFDDQIFTVVEESPQFPGGLKAMYKYIADEIKYPSRAQKANISGRVFLKFVVDKDGYVTNPTVLKGIGFGCDEEAIRVVKNFPRWQPGSQNGQHVNVYFTMPITFELDGVKYEAKTDKATTLVLPDEKIAFRQTINPKDKPLVVLNEVVVVGYQFNKLKPEEIASINVLKGAKAIEKYGEQGTKGVLEITTKK